MKIHLIKNLNFLEVLLHVNMHNGVCAEIIMYTFGGDNIIFTYVFVINMHKCVPVNLNQVQSHGVWYNLCYHNNKHLHLSQNLLL
jgi:hypothetical protein